MCEATTMGMIGGSLLGGLLASRQQVPNIPAPAAPEEAPQAAKTPDTQTVLESMKGMGQAGGAGGVAQTFLSGAGGVSKDKLNLDRKTLLS